MQQIMNGAQQMKADKPGLEERQKLEARQNELADLYENYERLADVRKRTWSSMVEW
jgi:hypothetical protein